MEGTVEAHTKYSAADTWEEVNKHANRLHGKMSVAIATTVASPLMSLITQTEESARAVDSLATNAATQLVSLNRRVEGLSGQLVSMAQKNRQQQESLEMIWEKVNLLPPPSSAPAPAAPRVAPAVHLPRPPPNAQHPGRSQ